MNNQHYQGMVPVLQHKRSWEIKRSLQVCRPVSSKNHSSSKNQLCHQVLPVSDANLFHVVESSSMNQLVPGWLLHQYLPLCGVLYLRQRTSELARRVAVGSKTSAADGFETRPSTINWSGTTLARHGVARTLADAPVCFLPSASALVRHRARACRSSTTQNFCHFSRTLQASS